MNDSQIETLLRKAPQPAAPPDLLERLQADITLAKSVRANGERPKVRQNPLQRWLPALAFGLFILSCLVIIGMQANVVSQLKQQNQELRSTTPDLEQLRVQQANYERLKTQQAQLERLRAENQDLQRLRAEVARLRPLTSELLRLRAENQSMAAAQAASRRSPLAAAAAESVTDLEKAASIKCLNNLKQISIAFRAYALDNQDRFPSALLQITNELGTPMILFCPSDSAKQPAGVIGWSEFRPEMTSYQLILSGTNDYPYPRRIISKCPIHGHVGLADGSVARVADAVRAGRAREVMIDGRLTLEWVKQGQEESK
jgi:hypothetical protein